MIKLSRVTGSPPSGDSWTQAPSHLWLCIQPSHDVNAQRITWGKFSWLRLASKGLHSHLHFTGQNPLAWQHLSTKSMDNAGHLCEHRKKGNESGGQPAYFCPWGTAAGKLRPQEENPFDCGHPSGRRRKGNQNPKILMLRYLPACGGAVLLWRTKK